MPERCGFFQALYSDGGYASHNQQFARIASTIVRLFTQPVVATAATLAKAHAPKKMLDDRMAHAWRRDGMTALPDGEAAGYVRCWRLSGHRTARQHRLDVVLCN